MINITLVGFFGGVSLNAVKSFIKYVFSYFNINANKDGAIIIVDRQSNKAVLTTDGINYKNVNGVENYVKEHHQTEGKGGYIYYTYVVDNMKKITDKNKVKQFAHNTYAKIRNSILTKFGKSFGNLKLNRIMNKNQISQITQDNDVIGRFLNDNGKNR